MRITRLQSSLEAINRAFGLGVGFSLIAMTLLVTASVVLRYVFRAPLLWSLEITQYLLLFSIFIAAAYTLLMEGHIKVDILLLHLPERARTITNIATSILGFAFSVVLTWQTGLLFWKSFQFHWVSPSTMEFYLPPIYAMMPLGSLFLCLAFLAKTRSHFITLQTRK